MDRHLSWKPAPEATRTGPEQTPDKARIGTGQAPDRGPRRQRKVWLRDEEWEALGRYFQTRGLSTSAGLRAWILERMRQEGID